MQSPSANDARDYETTLALLGRVAPSMPAAARSRAAWNVATAKLDLKAAVAAEGFNLHNAPATPPPPARATAPPVAPAPPAKPTPAPTAAEVAALRDEIAAFRAGPAAKPFPGENHEHIEAEAYPPSASRAMHNAAVALIKNDPGLSYRAAIVAVSRKS
jgi:dienelactone hydrolase